MPVQMRPGVEIDYLVSLYGLPIPWTSLIDVWESGVRSSTGRRLARIVGGVTTADSSRLQAEPS